MTDGMIGNGSTTRESPSPGRRLWPRFSLALSAFVLLLLSQRSFEIVVREYSRSFEPKIGPLIAFLGFGIAAGLAFGLALVLPQRLALRHPRRGLTLALMPVVVTGLNLIVALAPTALPEALGSFTSRYLFGLQSVMSVLLGLGVASEFADN